MIKVVKYEIHVMIGQVAIFDREGSETLLVVPEWQPVQVKPVLERAGAQVL
jgi:hypothetical protein